MSWHVLLYGGAAISMSWHVLLYGGAATCSLTLSNPCQVKPSDPSGGRVGVVCGSNPYRTCESVMERVKRAQLGSHYQPASHHQPISRTGHPQLRSRCDLHYGLLSSAHRITNPPGVPGFTIHLCRNVFTDVEYPLSSKTFRFAAQAVGRLGET